MSILVIVEHDNTAIASSTLNSITAAKQLGDEIHLLVAGKNCKKVASAACSIESISKVLLADYEQYEFQLAENLAELIVSIASNYTHILAPSTAFGKDLLPRAAALLDVALISDIQEIVSADTFIRPIYAGNALITLRSHDAIRFITVRCSAFKPAISEGGNAELVSLPSTADLNLSNFVEQQLNPSDRPPLGNARVVISGGRGLGNAHNFTLLEQIAEKLHAAIGASRAAVDAGLATNDLQVGQTGKIVAPELYIAVGISGAIQHLAGMNDSKVIVAINKDAEAAIFKVADYGLVADLTEVLPELVEKL